jgi:hypothetical protein
MPIGILSADSDVKENQIVKTTVYRSRGRSVRDIHIFATNLSDDQDGFDACRHCCCCKRDSFLSKSEVPDCQDQNGRIYRYWLPIDIGNIPEGFSKVRWERTSPGLKEELFKVRDELGNDLSFLSVRGKRNDL